MGVCCSVVGGDSVLHGAGLVEWCVPGGGEHFVELNGRGPFFFLLFDSGSGCRGAVDDAAECS